MSRAMLQYCYRVIEKEDESVQSKIRSASKPTWVYYATLLFVVAFWGMSSVAYYYFYRFYSAAVLTTIMTFCSAVLFWVITWKKRKQINGKLLKVALPICLLNAFANVLQRIGLQYTTPANYAFSEHLSCIVVPVMMFVFIRQKPKVFRVAAGVSCLIGCFILCGVTISGDGVLIGIGDVLCLIAGVLIGICIAAIAAYTQKMDGSLFMVLYMTSYFAVSLLMALSMHHIKLDGTAMEQAVITFDPLLLLAVAVFGLMDIALCWFLRTEAIRHIDPVAVATISPCSAVITGVISVLVGIDKLALNLIIGGSIIFVSVVIPEVIDALAQRKRNLVAQEQQ